MRRLRPFLALVVLAAFAAPAGAAWSLGAGTAHSCALACPLGHSGGDCCEKPQSAGSGPSFHRCVREEAALAPSALPPALPIAFGGSVPFDPWRPLEVPPEDAATSAFSPAIDHIPLRLA